MNTTLTPYHELRVHHIFYSANNDSWSVQYEITDSVSGKTEQKDLLFDRNSAKYSWDASAENIFHRLVDHLQFEIKKKIKGIKIP
jgi:hypothetical protein